MEWKYLISNKRFGQEGRTGDPDFARTDFQRDFDRLIFSSPFRRLQNKTQVFPLPGSVFVHNRLTHSLEVASVARSMGNMFFNELVKKDPELVAEVPLISEA
ncbi:MAG TPA: dehydrogenase, partial [Sphingobacteriaceae bacterium]